MNHDCYFSVTRGRIGFLLLREVEERDKLRVTAEAYLYHANSTRFACLISVGGAMFDSMPSSTPVFRCGEIQELTPFHLEMKITCYRHR